MAERTWATVLTAHELTQAEYAVIVVLGEHGSVGQGRLAELVAVDGRNLVAVVAGLETRRLVERRADEADARRRVVRLSNRGRSVLDRIRRAARATQADFLSALSEKERDSLNASLQRLFDEHTREK
jgi:DNA-binding MarR family transcriptional regulator